MTTTLLKSLVWREVVGRYRGSTLGLLWSLLTPLLMLAVYTFVFGVVLKSRWAVIEGSPSGASTAEFAVILFAGLVVSQIFSEVMMAAPQLVVRHANYVKKIVFPVEILPVVTVGAALFHAGVNLLVLLIAGWFVFGSVPVTAILAPVVLAPLVVLVLGVAWVLAAVGVYFRDMTQVVPPLVTALLFLSPLFFPRTALPVGLQPYLSLNPLSVPIEAFRDVTVFGVQPDWMALAIYSLVALAVAALGRQFFQLIRRGFADVL